MEVTVTKNSLSFALTSAAGPPRSMAERLALTFEAFETRSTQLSLDDVVARTGIPRSSTHRILDQLIELGWLEHTPQGYGLGQRAQRFREKENETNTLRAEAASSLHKLHVATGMVVHLATLEGANVHYLDKIGGRMAASIPSRVGGKNPAHSTALGKSVLAWMPPEQVDDVLSAGLRQLTTQTITDSGALFAELDHIRRRGGLAFETGESFEGIACVAAAVRRGRKPVASISLVGRGQGSVQRVAPLVMDAARQVSSALVSDP